MGYHDSGTQQICTADSCFIIIKGSHCYMFDWPKNKFILHAQRFLGEYRGLILLFWNGIWGSLGAMDNVNNVTGNGKFLTERYNTVYSLKKQVE
jgi:hypothetical protein